MERHARKVKRSLDLGRVGEFLLSVLPPGITASSSPIILRVSRVVAFRHGRHKPASRGIPREGLGFALSTVDGTLDTKHKGLVCLELTLHRPLPPAESTKLGHNASCAVQNAFKSPSENLYSLPEKAGKRRGSSELHV